MFIAKCYVRVGNKLYKPGEQLPAQIPEKVWKRLMQKKAIQTIHDPVAAVVEDEEEPEEIAPEEEVPEMEAAEEDAPEEATEDDAPAKAAPVVKPMADSKPAEKEAERKAKAAEKAAAKKEAKKAAKEAQELPIINAADLVVPK